MLASLFALPILLQVAAPSPPAAAARTLRLSDAVDMALQNQPTLHQARALTTAAEGRATQARAGFFPQITLVASYSRVRGTGIGGRATPTTNTVGALPSAIAAPDASGIDIFSFGGTASQLVWDFGATYNRSRAATRFVDSLAATEKATAVNVVTDVRRNYFTARAQKALIGVAYRTLENLERHLEQAKGFVAVGTQPEIAVAQARTNVANAHLSVIDAENAYAVSKAQLGRAIGLTDAEDFEVVDDELPPIDGEDLETERLVVRALAARPELLSFEKQRQAYQLTAKAYRGAYGPALNLVTGASETGTDLGDLGPAWNVGVNLTWPIFQGGLTRGQVRESEANAAAAGAQGDGAKLQVRVEVRQAKLDLRSAKAAQSAAADALTYAREQYRLAEGRFASGLGNTVEISDAQVALTTAEAQVVQSQFRLSTARAELLAALGQR